MIDIEAFAKDTQSFYLQCKEPVGKDIARKLSNATDEIVQLRIVLKNLDNFKQTSDIEDLQKITKSIYLHCEKQLAEDISHQLSDATDEIVWLRDVLKKMKDVRRSFSSYQK